MQGPLRSSRDSGPERSQFLDNPQAGTPPRRAGGLGPSRRHLTGGNQGAATGAI
jgi:hypothetical protein